MQKLVLYIGNQGVYTEDQRIDLFKDETVSLTQTIQNVKDIKKIFTEFTQTFSVPASKKNNKIFKHYYNFTIDNGFDARIKVNATLELNDLPFKIGKITLNGVDLKNNLAHTYRVTFFGNTVDLKDILANSQLSSLTSLAAYNQIYSYTKVKAAIQDYAVGSNQNILVPLITHTDRMIYNSTDNDDTNIYTNVYSSSQLEFQDNGINWNQFKYAIRVKTIIDAIQTQYPSITFSNDFFNDVNNLTFHNLFLWLHRKKGSVEGISQIDENFTQLNQLNNTSCTPFGTCNNQISAAANGILELRASSPYRIIGTTLQINLPSGANNYSVRLIRNGSEIVASSTNASSTVNFTELLENDSTYSVEIASTGGVTFAANSIIWIVTWDVPNGTGAGSAGSLTYKNPQSFTTTSDFDFNINSQIPKMSIIDFLTGLFQMFNLTAFVDESGTIVVKTLDDYYAAASETINIDQYLDVTKSTIDVALPFNKVNFGYKGLGTFLAKQYEQLFNSGWGSESYTLDGDIFDAPSSPYSIELPFEHLMYERIYNITGATSTTIQWGYFVNDNQESYFGSPLLFYPILQDTSTTRIAFRNTIPNEKSFIDDYFIPSNSLALSPSTSKVNIHFRPMINEYLANESGQLSNDFTDTLFQTKYKTYIEDVFNRQRRLTKVTAFLPYKIFSSLELNDTIQLGQNNYRINSLKTNLTNGKTEFELLNTIL